MIGIGGKYADVVIGRYCRARSCFDSVWCWKLACSSMAFAWSRMCSPLLVLLVHHPSGQKYRMGVKRTEHVTSTDSAVTGQ